VAPLRSQNEVNIRIGLTKELGTNCCKSGLQNEAMQVYWCG